MIEEGGPEWCKQIFSAMNDGAIWGVPRSGLIFKKEKGKLILAQRMPYLPEMSSAFTAGDSVPPSPSALEKHQQSDVDAITAHFRAAGIEVEDRTTPKKGS